MDAQENFLIAFEVNYATSDAGETDDVIDDDRTTPPTEDIRAVRGPAVSFAKVVGVVLRDCPDHRRNGARGAIQGIVRLERRSDELAK